MAANTARPITAIPRLICNCRVPFTLDNEEANCSQKSCASNISSQLVHNDASWGSLAPPPNFNRNRSKE